MKKIYPFIFLLFIYVAARPQYVQKVTNINYYGYNGLNPSNLTVFAGKLYFFGTDNTQYVDKLMYTPDGSAAGITVVKQIDSVIQYPSLKHLTILNNLLIFDNVTHLWKSDGTAAGTSMIKTIRISSTKFVVLNGKVFFAGDITNSNPVVDQLWQTDGTATGTTLVKTINATGAAYISNMFVSGGKIFFGATDGINQQQLWISDGTTAGTYMLKQLNPATGANPYYFTTYNSKLYFAADDGVTGTQLWVTDGTTSGTTRVTHKNPGSTGLYPSNFTFFNSRLFFMGYDTNAFAQLWSTDGTNAGTLLVKADHTPRSGYAGFMPNSMAVHNNLLYMAGFDSLTAKNQLWVSDGTTAGTHMVTHFPNGFTPSRLYSFQNKLIMTAGDTLSGNVELFASDGTAAGTICPTPPSNGQDAFYPWEAWVPFNNCLYYKAAYGYFADYQLCRYSETPFGIAQQTYRELFVYPNPTQGLINIVFPDRDSNSDIEIYNNTGSLVYSKAAETTVTTIDLKDKAAGLYIVKVISNHQTATTLKIIKE
jgi:ELWxxDGT repeat protein